MAEAGKATDFSGTWCESKFENGEAFAKAQGIPLEQAQKMSGVKATVSITQDGDAFTVCVKAGDKELTEKFTVGGDEFESVRPPGVPIVCKATWNDDKSQLQMTAKEKESGKQAPSITRKIQNNQLLEVWTANGVSATRYFDKK